MNIYQITRDGGKPGEVADAVVYADSDIEAVQVFIDGGDFGPGTEGPDLWYDIRNYEVEMIGVAVEWRTRSGVVTRYVIEPQ